MTLSPDQLEQRSLGIGASDIGAILGHNPYRSRLDVWREKRGEAPPFEGNVRTKWGILLEPVIRADYEERHGVRVEVPGTLQHPEHAWWLASPDGLVYPSDGAIPARGLEIKTHSFYMRNMYGAPGTDEVPLWELAQCMWCIGATGLPRWDLVPFLDGQPSEYIIDRDDELLGLMRYEAERFLVDNVRGGKVPDPDGSEGDSKTLARVWKKTNGTLINIGDDLDTFTIVEKAKELRERAADALTELEATEQALKIKIADSDGLTWKNASGKVEKISWKHSKPQRWVDFASINHDLRQVAALASSGKKNEIETAITALKGIGGHIGSSAMSGIAISKLIAVLRDALLEIVRAPTEADRTKHYTNRPMFFPRSWKSPKAQEQ